MSTQSKVVLVTGASSGIGAATAARLAREGHRVLAGARRTERLTELAGSLRADGADVRHASLDVTDPDSVQAFADLALEQFGRIDVLVNNAGVMPLSPLHERRLHEWNQMIDVNVRGVLHGIAAVLPVMRAQGGGHVVNVASVSGLRVDPTAAVYSATKFAVRAISEGLRQESQDVRVTVVCPGFTRTELTHTGGSPQAQQAARAATDQLAISPGAIAAAIAFAIGQPADVDVNELVIRPTAQG